MKLLCTESNGEICRDIIRRLADAGIDAQVRQKEPSLFDSGQTPSAEKLSEVWIVDDTEIDKANAILYPESP